jgi:hypothetical protein
MDVLTTACSGARAAGHPAVPLGHALAEVALTVVGLLLCAAALRRPSRARTPARAVLRERRGLARSFLTTYVLTLPNPVTVGVFGAATLVSDAGRGATAAATFAIGVGAATLGWHLVLALLGRRLLAAAGVRLRRLCTGAVGPALVSWSLLT